MATDINLEAFVEIQGLFDGKRLDKVFKQELSLLTPLLDRAIKNRTLEVYEANKSKLEASSKISKVENINNVFRTSILYRHKPVGLASMFSFAEWGNINFPNKRQGRVHTVTVKKNTPKISTGYEHRGGFIPRERVKGKFRKQKQFLNSNSTLIKKKNMYERTGADRLSKLRLLFAPSPAQMVGYLLTKDSKLQEQIFEATDTSINKALELYYKGK